MAATIDRKIYPPVSFFFKVTFNGVGNGGTDARFQEVSGLSHEIGTEDLVEGGENRFSFRLPTRGKYANLVLKRGVMMNTQLIDWITRAIDNFTFEPVNIDVVLLTHPESAEGDPVPLVTWNFFKAYPVKWANSDLKSTDNAVLVETLELAYQYYTKTYQG
jgi:phage tail-like protein